MQRVRFWSVAVVAEFGLYTTRPVKIKYTLIDTRPERATSRETQALPGLDHN